METMIKKEFNKACRLIGLFSENNRKKEPNTKKAKLKSLKIRY